MEKKIREYIRIGDVFCVEFDKKYKRYFQYVTFDESCLSSRVIRVFAKVYDIKANVDTDEIVSDKVDCYIHVLIKVGIDLGLWYKIGKSKNIGSINDIVFRDYAEFYIKGMEVSHNWLIWHVSQKRINIGDLKPEFVKYSWGGIYSPYIVYQRIATGKYSGKIFEIK